MQEADRHYGAGRLPVLVPRDIETKQQQRGRPRAEAALRHAAFREACRKGGVPQIRLHDLRHPSASLGLAAGETLRLPKAGSA